MAEKCPKCGAGRAMSPTGLRVYKCGSRSRGDGTQFETSAICTDSQLAQKDRELEEAKAEIRETQVALTTHYMEQLGAKQLELEQSRQSEAQAWAMLARVKGWAHNSFPDGYREDDQTVGAVGLYCERSEVEDLRTILADTPEVLAVVDDIVRVEGRTTQYAAIKFPVDLEPETPIRVIVLRRDERGK